MLELANWKLDLPFKESTTLQITLKNYFKEIIMSNHYVKENGDFPDGPVVRTCTFTAKGLSSIPGWGTKIPQVHGVAKKPPKGSYHAKCCPNISSLSFSREAQNLDLGEKSYFKNPSSIFKTVWVKENMFVK